MATVVRVERIVIMNSLLLAGCSGVNDDGRIRDGVVREWVGEVGRADGVIA
jgi:hypothetical protein